jgi:3-phenylpropionate/trans-cinnamate dioxygenase ferredoxin subunit
MADFVEVALLEQVVPGKSLFVYVGETGVALFNIDGKIYAINDTCVHQGSSLAQGRLNGKIVTCRGHGWKYDVTTGRLTLNPDSGVASYPVEVVDGKIMVAIEEKPGM